MYPHLASRRWRQTSSPRLLQGQRDGLRRKHDADCFAKGGEDNVEQFGLRYSCAFWSHHGREAWVTVYPLHDDLVWRVRFQDRCLSLWLRGVISPVGLDRIPKPLLQGRNSANSAYQSGKMITAQSGTRLVRPLHEVWKIFEGQALGSIKKSLEKLVRLSSVIDHYTETAGAFRRFS
jgi:hypothetical protein